jgi:UDP-N-acetylglucosamine acyltransferase
VGLEERVVLAVATSIHPSAAIGPGVELGDAVTVGAHVSLTGPMVVGDRVVISAGATVGGPAEVVGVPQADANSEGKGVVLEPDVVIRENVVIHQGTRRPTTVGEGSWILSRSYLAHDVQVGRRCVVSAGTSIGGLCTVGDLVTIGMNAAVHQKRRIGRGAMVGMGSVVTHDVPPWAKAYGVPIRLCGINEKAMRRAELDEDTIATIAAAYVRGATDLSDPPSDVVDDFEWWRSLSARRILPVAGGGQ